LRLEDIKAESEIIGILPGGPVKVVAAKAVGPDVVTVYFSDPAGGLQERMLSRADEAKLSLIEKSSAYTFDADPLAFKLAAEAQRIQLAHLFDPVLAVHSSDVQALPHQITAVYESMLNRQPLRFLLADDPGAGKTIMAGLLIRELMIRGDVQRCLIIAPGSLVPQWQDEMDDKFNLDFELMSNELVENTRSGNPFTEPRHSFLIARLDHLARNEELKAKFNYSEWDLIIFDEAHKLSAHWEGTNVRYTGRYRLAVDAAKRCRHLLLMTATPHNGKDDDFRLFLSLLDSDRFVGRMRDEKGNLNVGDIMRRMVKEDLMTFEGKKLFPERKAYTLPYPLSPGELALYDRVTKYVREEMNKADKLDGARRGSVGFALTTLQRRLVSSPEAIYNSLRRRRENLEKKLLDEQENRGVAVGNPFTPSVEDLDDEDDYSAEELEALEEDLVTNSSTAERLSQLKEEVDLLKELESEAEVVLKSRTDHKWTKLSEVLQQDQNLRRPDGSHRKLIIFTEHKDTLNYLVSRIKDVFGRDDSVVSIFGGTRREDRRKAQLDFEQNKDVVVLVATDAAGEGVNLQCANVVINYDLPWNPNRLEQRFGRVHRIGQTEVCHLFNLVSADTREGEVFKALLDKLAIEAAALGGRVFDVLGEAFPGKTLKELLINAIRYGNDPKAREDYQLQTTLPLDADKLKALMEEKGLSLDHMDSKKLFAVKADMEKAQARRLQPHFIKTFFVEGFKALGGGIHEREPGRFEITRVPQTLRAMGPVVGGKEPLLEKYDRVCFEKERRRVKDKSLARLLAPGHALMDAVVGRTLELNRSLLKSGALLVDPEGTEAEPYLLYILEHSVVDGTKTPSGQPHVVSRRLQFVRVRKTGEQVSGGWAPHLDLRPATEAEATVVAPVLQEGWLKGDLEGQALATAVTVLVPEHLKEIKDRRERQVDMIKDAVRERLTREIVNLQKKAAKLEEEVKAGRQPQVQVQNAEKTARDLQERMDVRLVDLEAQRHISPLTPHVLGCALVLPQLWLEIRKGGAGVFAKDQAAKDAVEAAGMNSVMQEERRRGFTPVDVSAENRGWDIESGNDKGVVRLIEVKGRVKGAPTVTVTRNEIMQSLNHPDCFFLALVIVDGDKAARPRYISKLTEREPGFHEASVNYKVEELLKMAEVTVS
jgi:superfamily II DNA or RNA helicase